MKMPYKAVVAGMFFAVAVPLIAKSKVSNVFDAPPASVYDAVYRYAQRHGKIKWADEKRFTLYAEVFVPGGNWDWEKHFDCTISVEATEDGRKAIVDVVGTFPANQLSLVGRFREGPAAKVLKAIREEFDWEAAQLTKAAINVNGGWYAKDWGKVVLNQAPGSSDLTGKGDGWDITGVVSGKQVFLHFSNDGSVVYSAELTAEGENSLNGSYSKGFMSDRGKGRPMHLTKQ